MNDDVKPILVILVPIKNYEKSHLSESTKIDTQGHHENPKVEN